MTNQIKATSTIHPMAAANTAHPLYNEAASLQRLLEIIDDTAAENENMTDGYSNPLTDIQIIIGGQVTAFYLGGPQLTALEKFIGHIALENGYQVDFVASTVSED